MEVGNMCKFEGYCLVVYMRVNYIYSGVDVREEDRIEFFVIGRVVYVRYGFVYWEFWVFVKLLSLSFKWLG